MPVRRNFQLARVFGIRIGVGVSWFVILGLILIYFADTLTPYFHEVLGGSRTTAYLVMVAIVLSFFASVILHELGHALVARRNGVPVMGIELWALGRPPVPARCPARGWSCGSPRPGRSVTLAVILASTALGAAVASSHHFFAVAVGSSGVLTTPVVLWLSWLVTLNVLVLLLNLIPAFPLDGAQIVHALHLVAHRRPQPCHPRGGAHGPGFRGAAWRRRPRCAGGAARHQRRVCWRSRPVRLPERHRRGAAGPVRPAHPAPAGGRRDGPEPVTIPAEPRLLDAQEHFFLRYRWPWFAVVDPARHFLGVVRSERVDAEIAAGRPALPVTDVLEEDLPVRIERGSATGIAAALRGPWAPGRWWP